VRTPRSRMADDGEEGAAVSLSFGIAPLYNEAARTLRFEANMSIRRCACLIVVILGCVPLLGAPAAKVEMPEPLELDLDLPMTLEQVLLVTEKFGYEVVEQDRAAGLIRTRDDESIGGAYADSELKKIAVVVTDYQTSFHKGKYRMELQLSFLAPQRTAVAASAVIRGLKRSADGTEEWVPLKSNGVLEMRFLNELSYLVTGKRPYEKKLQYWKKSSQEIILRK